MTETLPSWKVTDAQLTEMGFPVEVLDKVCGSKTVTRPGMKRSAALHKAWAQGLVRMETEPFPRRHQAPSARPTVDREMLAFLTGK